MPKFAKFSCFVVVLEWVEGQENRFLNYPCMWASGTLNVCTVPFTNIYQDELQEFVFGKHEMVSAA